MPALKGQNQLLDAYHYQTKMLIIVIVRAYSVDVTYHLVGHARASISGKSGHAFIVYRGFDADKPKEFR